MMGYNAYNKKEGRVLDWSHLAKVLPSRTCFRRKYREKGISDGKTRKKT